MYVQYLEVNRISSTKSSTHLTDGIVRMATTHLKMTYSFFAEEGACHRAMKSGRPSRSRMRLD